MRKVLTSLFVCIALLALAEWGLRRVLFERVSYSNSESIDRQLRERDTATDWTLLFVGDSETRWGIHPAEIDAAFQRKGLAIKSFNHAFDGFGASWWPVVLPALLRQPALSNVEVVVLGVQMIDTHRVVRATGDATCGSLQKPVLTSSFGIDLGLHSLCRSESWDSTLGRDIFGALWSVRYSSAVRSLVLPRTIFGTPGLQFNSAKEGESYRGFEPHRSIDVNQEAYNSEFVRWKAQYIPEQDFQSLPPVAWQQLTAPSGFFDELNRTVVNSGRRLVLFALPTNPVVIDTFRRREDYRRNSELLQKWSVERGVPFVDLGIQDVPNPSQYFSDMRHLSGTGAHSYSRQLGEALATQLGGCDPSRRQSSGHGCPPTSLEPLGEMPLEQIRKR
jgi:hypothetical protein